MKHVAKKLVALIMVVGLMVSLMPANVAAATKVKLNQKSVIITKGDEVKLSLNTYVRGTWKTSNKKIATVDSYGYVRGRGNGSCKIKFVYGKKTLTCKVTVETPAISDRSVVLMAGETYQLTAQGTTRDVYWLSEDESIASVDENGLIHAMAEGYISVEMEVGGHTYYCTVEVKKKTTYSQQKPVVYADRNVEIRFYSISSGTVEFEVKNLSSIELCIQGNTIVLDGKSYDDSHFILSDEIAPHSTGIIQMDFDDEIKGAENTKRIGGVLHVLDWNYSFESYDAPLYTVATD